MVAEVAESLGKLEIKPVIKYTDITESLLAAASKLDPSAVVKSPHYNLFEATQALEIGHPKLDTGLIDLTVDEKNFDVSQDRSLAEVLNVTDSIVRLTLLWLENNHMLSTSVLSCRYMEELLVKYNRGNKRIQDLTFGTGCDLVHKVLRSVCLSAGHFIRFCLQLAESGVIVIEEDIVAQTMDLDFFGLLNAQDVVVELQESIKLVQGMDQSTDSKLLLALLSVLLQLSQLSVYIGCKEVDMQGLEMLSSSVELLQNSIEYLNGLPSLPGCFSLGNQMRLTNRCPIMGMVSARDIDYQPLTLLANDIKGILTLPKAANALEMYQFFQFFVKKNHHVVARAFLPLYFIRDSQSIMGETPFFEFTLNQISMFSLEDSSILGTSSAQAFEMLSQMVGEIMPVTFDFFQAKAQNPSRYRQGLSRQILQWDSLHATLMGTECSLNKVEGVRDTFVKNGEEMLALPITTWIFYMKINVMLEFLLQGFVADVYMPEEFFSIYCFIQHLCEQQGSVLDDMMLFIDTRVKAINNMKAKAKKLKGDKKAAYKTKMDSKLENVLPKLEKNKKYIEFLQTENQVTLLMARQQVQAFGIIGKHVKMNPSEKLFNLRFKEFSSIGVPQSLTFNEVYRLHSNLSGMNKDGIDKSFANLKRIQAQVGSDLDKILNAIQHDDESSIVVGTKLCKDDALSWYRGLKASSIKIVNQAEMLYNLKDPQRLIVVFEDCNPTFPVLDTK